MFWIKGGEVRRGVGGGGVWRPPGPGRSPRWGNNGEDFAGTLLQKKRKLGPKSCIFMLNLPSSVANVAAV